MAKNVKTIMDTRRMLMRRFHDLQDQLKAVRQKLAELPLVGHYSPQTRIQVCKCGVLLSARDMYQHTCSEKPSKGKPKKK